MRIKRNGPLGAVALVLLASCSHTKQIREVTMSEAEFQRLYSEWERYIKSTWGTGRGIYMDDQRIPLGADANRHIPFLRRQLRKLPEVVLILEINPGLAKVARARGVEAPKYIVSKEHAQKWLEVLDEFEPK